MRQQIHLLVQPCANVLCFVTIHANVIEMQVRCTLPLAQIL